jgi:hypothetical protein
MAPLYVDGRLALPLRVGQYTMEIESTPEYRTVTSQPFEIERHADDSKRVELPRFANLAEEGWWAGDLDVARPLADLPLAMRAEGLNVVAVIVSPARAASGARRTSARKAADADAAAQWTTSTFPCQRHVGPARGRRPSSPSRRSICARRRRTRRRR